MKRFFVLFLVLVMAVCLFSACEVKKPEEEKETENYGKIIYVSVDGDDANDGTKEFPLATLGGAAAKVREYKTANGLPEGGIKVEFAAGTYRLNASVKIGAEDGGEEGKEIVYAAADGAEVIFDGGISLNPSDFKPANDEFKARLYSEEAKANVLEIDLAAGIWDADDSKMYSVGGTGYACTFDYRQSLYVNNELQDVARWPNGEYGKTEVLEEYNGVSTLLKIPDGRAGLWDRETGVRLYGYPTYDWESFFTWTTRPIPGSGGIAVDAMYTDGRPFYFFNIATELDSPGEYYWDVAANMLYYWPKDGFESSKISFSQLADYGIDVSGSSRITFDGMIFESFRNSPIYGDGVSDITVCNCVFRGTARSLWFGGDRITIDSNEFYNLGGGAIYIEGGDYASRGLSESVITNKIIHDFGQVYTVYNAGINVNGLGYLIAHNEIFNAPHTAILFCGGMTTIEYNYVHNVCSETSDVGAINTGGRWDWNGNTVRYNYIRDITDTVYGGEPKGIYFDDCIANQFCYGNVIVNTGGCAVALSGGRNLSIYNNVMVNTNGISLDERGFSWYPTVTSYPDGQLWSYNVADNFLTDLWKYSDPQYLSVLEMRTTQELDALKGITADMLDSPAPPAYADICNNIDFNCDGVHTANKNADSIDGSAYMFGHIAENTVYTDNPEDVFVDPANGNFFLKDDSRVYRDVLNFEKWDYSLLGIQK